MASDTLDTNLLQSAKRPKGEAPKGGNTLGPARIASKQKRIAKVVAYVVFFFWSLIAFTLIKIPDSVIANFLLNTLNQSTPYQWQAEKISIGFFPTPHLKMEKLGLEPKIPGSGVPLFLDEIRIYPNPFSLIPFGGAPSFGGSFKADAYKSTVRGSFSSGANLSLSVNSDSIDFAKLTPLTSMGTDLKGLVTNLYLQSHLPSQRLSMADGELQLKAKNIIFDPSTLNLPMALPILNLGDVDVQGTMSRGQLKIEKFKVGSAGKDLEMQIPSGTVNFSDVMQNTRYEIHLLLKPSPSINAAVPMLKSMLESMATLKPDGFYALKLQGTIAAPAFPAKD